MAKGGGKPKMMNFKPMTTKLPTKNRTQMVGGLLSMSKPPKAKKVTFPKAR
jgi:hypothetical protein